MENYMLSAPLDMEIFTRGYCCLILNLGNLEFLFTSVVNYGQLSQGQLATRLHKQNINKPRLT